MLISPPLTMNNQHILFMTLCMYLRTLYEKNNQNLITAVYIVSGGQIRGPNQSELWAHWQGGLK